MIEFEWDSNKAIANLKKHGVSFEEARSVFYDENALQFYDEDHSVDAEDRFLMLGLSNEARVLLICHCENLDRNRIRIISARKATTSERKFYQGEHP